MRYSNGSILVCYLVSDLGPFGSASAQSINDSWKITLGSCLHASARPWLSLSAMVARRPDAALLLGDTIYADYEALSDQWERPGSAAEMSEGELATRLSRAWDLTIKEPHFASLLNSTIPIYAIWDDHEFVNNYDAGVETALYRTGRSAFDNYLLPSLTNPKNRSGSYFNVSFPKADVFFMDTRSYREKLSSRRLQEMPSECGTTMLGMDQKKAFREWLENVPLTKWTIVVSSGMLNDYPGDEEIDYSGDCAEVDCSSDVWYRFKEERDEIVSLVSGATSNALFLSGDSHYPGVFKLGDQRKSVLELSASPLGAFSFATPQSAVEAMRNGGNVMWVPDGEDLTRVFGEVDIADGMALTARINSVDSNGAVKELFSHTQPFRDVIEV